MLQPKELSSFANYRPKLVLRSQILSLFLVTEKKKHFNREETHISPNPRISEHLLAKNYVNSQPLMFKKEENYDEFQPIDV